MFETFTSGWAAVVASWNIASIVSALLEMAADANRSRRLGEVCVLILTVKVVRLVIHRSE
jgi:hypothetical protein